VELELQYIQLQQLVELWQELLLLHLLMELFKVLLAEQLQLVLVILAVVVVLEQLAQTEQPLQMRLVMVVLD
jgi:hypothetical protein